MLLTWEINDDLLASFYELFVAESGIPVVIGDDSAMRLVALGS